MSWHERNQGERRARLRVPTHGPMEAATAGGAAYAAHRETERGGRLADAPPSVLDAIAGSMLVHFLRAPALVGGIVPSSPVLAQAMARQAAGFDAIVELGAGTGAVTRRLAHEHPRAALTIIERERALARRLAPTVRARLCVGCVHEREADLLAQPPRAVAVSSLPFRSLPPDVAAATIAALERFLLAHSARRLVQYSYGLRAPFAFVDARLAWRRVERVWRNVPPAIVWTGGLRA
jgi:phospholipid N-methyltransferase